MAAGDFFSERARARTADVVRRVESMTSAEVLVAVRRLSGHYRHTDYLVGFGLALGVLLVLLYTPQPFHLATWPVDLVLAFVVGALLSASVPDLRRVLTSRRLMDANVRRAARAAFVEAGVMRTQARVGVLVYASILERRVAVVCDIGIDADSLGAPWKEAVARLEGSLARGADLAGFLDALEGLGPALKDECPRLEDDVNELPDEVHVG